MVGKVIANIARKISDQPHIANLMSVPHMADLVVDMIDDSMRAYENDSVEGIQNFLRGMTR